MRMVLKMAVLAYSVALAQPASAALAPSSDLSAAGSYAVIDGSEMTEAGAPEAIAEICVPPDAQYIPTFVRGDSGEIVGITYTVIEYVC